MDIPRELIYQDKQSLDDFGVKGASSLNKILFVDYLMGAQELKVGEYGFNVRALKAFNDAYYACTVILKVRGDFEIAYFKDRVSEMSVVMPMVYVYLNRLNEKPEHTSVIKKRIEGYAKERCKQLDTLLNKKKKLLDRKLFDPCQITKDIASQVHWWEATDRFNEDSISKLVRVICKNEDECRIVTEAIKESCLEFEWNYNNELRPDGYYDDETGQWEHIEEKPINLSASRQLCDKLLDEYHRDGITFQACKGLQDFLGEEWFKEYSSKTNTWRNDLVQSLIDSEFGTEIAEQWCKNVRQKRTVIKMALAGALKDAGVLKAQSNPPLARSIFDVGEYSIEVDSLAKYMGYGKNQPYYRWLVDTITSQNEENPTEANPIEET